MKQDVGYPTCPAGRRPAGLPKLLLCAATLSPGVLTAAEIYKWTDANGVVHYSQTPPAHGQGTVVEAPEAYKPGSVSDEPPPATAGEDAGENGSAGEEAPLTAAQARRQQLAQQRETARERQAENRQLCDRHRQRIEQMEPARRVFYTDEAGEQVRMDDDLRLALIEESRTFVDENCGD